jgi:hypothetical protein
MKKEDIFEAIGEIDDDVLEMHRQMDMRLRASIHPKDTCFVHSLWQRALCWLCL